MATKIGSELTVNTTLTDNQFDPVITSLSDGRFVVAWTDDSEPGLVLHSNVRARIFNANGTESKAEFVVNDVTTGQQDQAAIAALSTGGFVVTWTDHESSDGFNLEDIYAQTFDSNGIATTGNDILINSDTDQGQTTSAVSALANGGFVVTWLGDEIRARTFGENGSSPGAEFIVNNIQSPNASVLAFDPNVATLSNGNFVVTWHDNTPMTDDDFRGQFFTAPGTEVGGEFPINETPTTGSALANTIAALGDGRFVAAWSHNLDVVAQIFNSDGTPASTEVIVNTTTAGTQTQPTIAALGGGRFVVAWQDTSAGALGDTSGSAIVAQVFNADGSKYMAPFLVNTETTIGSQVDPSITAIDDNRFVVTWETGTDIQAQIFGAGVEFHGGGGNDTRTGTEFDDILDGGAGNDTLIGGAGEDTLLGGSGSDLLLGTADGDSIDGGSGSDTASYSGSNTGVTVSLAAGTATGGHATGDTLTSIENLTGSAHDDTLVGDGGANVLNGAAGADALDGGGGSDTASYTGSNAAVNVSLLTGTASGGYADGDTLIRIENLIGSAHNDMLTGNAAGNQINGGAGADTIDGGGGSDTASYTGSNAAVTVNLGTGAATGGYAQGDILIAIESLVGSGLNDTLIGNAGANALNGGAGADTLNGGGGTDTASYTGSNAGVTVNLGTGTASGGYAQGDTLTSIENLVGSGLNDLLTGNGAANALNGGAGADNLDGGGGTDTASYTGSSAGVTVNLGTGTASGGYAQGDTLTSIESLVGSSFNDTLTGNSLGNALTGGQGADTLDGGAGIDTASYSSSSAGVTVNLATGTGAGGDATGDTLSNIENITGSAHGDTLTGNDLANLLTGGGGADTLNGGGGNDTLIGGAGGDTLIGGSGTDAAAYVGSSAGVTVNLATGTASGGDAAGDTFDSIENLTGSSHADTITGHGLVNVLNGGLGNDTLTGGAGGDTFFFNSALNAATNVDSITDFDISTDRISLENAIFTAFATTGTLAAEAFFGGAGATAAQDASDRIVYDTTTGALYYDADGLNGAAAIQFATLTTHPAVVGASDFMLV